MMLGFRGSNKCPQRQIKMLCQFFLEWTIGKFSFKMGTHVHAQEHVPVHAQTQARAHEHAHACRAHQYAHVHDTRTYMYTQT